MFSGNIFPVKEIFRSHMKVGVESAGFGSVGLGTKALWLRLGNVWFQLTFIEVNKSRGFCRFVLQICSV